MPASATRKASSPPPFTDSERSRSRRSSVRNLAIRSVLLSWPRPVRTLLTGQSTIRPPSTSSIAALWRILGRLCTTLCFFPTTTPSSSRPKTGTPLDVRSSSPEADRRDKGDEIGRGGGDPLGRRRRRVTVASARRGPESTRAERSHAADGSSRCPVLKGIVPGNAERTILSFSGTIWDSGDPPSASGLPKVANFRHWRH